MELDQAAQAANRPKRNLYGNIVLLAGWIGDAIAAVGRWIWAAIVGIGLGVAWLWKSFWGLVFDFWDFLIRNIPIGLAMAAGTGLASFEIFNAKKGWGAMFPGIAEPVLWGGAAGMIFGFIWVFRQAREARRDKGYDSKEYQGWRIAVAATFLACLFGIWSSTASNAVEKTDAAQESKATLQKMETRRDELRGKLEVSNVAFFEAEIFEKQRLIESYVGTAQAGYDLDDLEVETCSSKSIPIGARRICNRVNGGVDPYTNEEYVGERNLIERLERSKEQAAAEESELTELIGEIAAYQVVQGDQLQRAIADLVGEDRQFMARSIFYIVISGLVIAISAYLWDHALEAIETKRKAARERAGKAV